MTASEVFQIIGAACFGAIIGWFIYFANRYRTGEVSFADITTLLRLLFSLLLVAGVLFTFFERAVVAQSIGGPGGVPTELQGAPLPEHSGFGAEVPGTGIPSYELPRIIIPYDGYAGTTKPGYSDIFKNLQRRDITSDPSTHFNILVEQQRWNEAERFSGLHQAQDPRVTKDFVYDQIKEWDKFYDSSLPRPPIYRPFAQQDRNNTACICNGDPSPPIPLPSITVTAAAGYIQPETVCGLVWQKQLEICKSGLISAGWNPAPNVSPNNYRKNRVNNIRPKSFGTTVALLRADNSTICSGVLIGNDYILTAAHCYCNGERPSAAFFGDEAWAKPQQSHEPVLRAQYPISTKPEWFSRGFCKRYQSWKNNPDSIHPKGDLVMVRLLSKLGFVEKTSLLPTEPLWGGESYDEALIAGFGYADNANISGRKHFAPVTIKPGSCNHADKTQMECHPGSEFIAKPPVEGERNDSCFADSGGPLFVDSGEHRYLAGIVSRGVSNNPERKCGKGGVYVDLRNLQIRKWIFRTAGFLD